MVSFLSDLIFNLKPYSKYPAFSEKTSWLVLLLVLPGLGVSNFTKLLEPSGSLPKLSFSCKITGLIESIISPEGFDR